MKNSNKGFDYCINGQVVVDEAHQIIIGADVTSDANDKQQAVPMATKTRETLASAGISFPIESDEPQDSPQQAGQERSKPESGRQKKVPISMDNGYMSEDAVFGTERQGFDPHIAVGRQKHHQPLLSTASPNAETQIVIPPWPKITRSPRKSADRPRPVRHQGVSRPDVSVPASVTDAVLESIERPC